MDNDSIPLSSDLGSKKNLNLDPSNSGSSIEDESDDYRGQIESNELEKSESEIVADNNAEQYGDESTGIKLKYKLTASEIGKYIYRARKYKGSIVKIENIAIQLVIFLILIFGTVFTGNRSYLIMSMVPFSALILMTVFSFLNFGFNKKILLSKNDFIVDVFNDRIEIENNNFKNIIDFDDDYKCDEYENMLIIIKDKTPQIIIPIRAIDEDYAAEVQAIIAAGTTSYM